ncbi:MAG: hypothetical protein M3P18_26035 [Actinomycetota bacterium]|nr:hypothetical protein [Actinomycetota bacterium]
MPMIAWRSTTPGPCAAHTSAAAPAVPLARRLMNCDLVRNAAAGNPLLDFETLYPD